MRLLALLLAASPLPALAQAAQPEKMVYKQAGEAALAAHVFRPAAQAQPAAAALLFHGGGWQAGRPEWTYAAARQLQAQGMVAIPIEYRLSRGAVTPADAVADACDAFAWAREQALRLGIDPARVAGYGVSAGGHLVAAAGLGACGARRGPDLMLLWSPALDLERDGWFAKLMQGGDGRAITPLLLATRRGPDAAVIQGDKDSVTPLRGATAFCAARRAAKAVCDLHVYPGLGHLLSRNLAEQESNFDVDPEADRDGDAKLAGFLRSHGYLR